MMTNKQPGYSSASDLRQRAEAKLQKDSASRDPIAIEDTQRLIHELQVHQVELEMQNHELRLAHTQLEISHDRYADLYDFAPVGYMTVTQSGIIVEANLTLARWLGLDRLQLVGRRFTDFVANEDQDIAYLHHEKILESRQPQHTEMQLVSQDRTQFYARLDCVMREDGSDQPPAVRSVITNITERKLAEELLASAHAQLETRVMERTVDLNLANSALHESEDRLRFAMEVADICYWVWDPQTDLLRWGGPSERVFDMEPDEPLKTFAMLVERAHPLDRDGFRQTMDNLLAGEVSPQLEFRITWRAGDTRWVLVQAQAYQSLSTAPYCVLGVMQDITERKQSEQARAELLRTAQMARDVAEQATQIRTQFLGTVSHELRSPLTSIKGFTSTLLADDITFDAQTQRQILEIINEETDKLVELVEHLLELSQLQVGKLKIHSSSVSLDTIIAVGRAQFEALTSHHQLILAIPSDLGQIMADKVRIAQVITNLISNAVKHSPQNTLITVSAIQIDGFLHVNVSDQGSGIPSGEREKVFQAFQQLETQRHLPSGVGLGLAICKSLVEAHGGRIWVEEQAKPGTTISFTLPLDTLQQG